MLLTALAVAAIQPGDLKIHGDWIAGCDNGRVCQAVSLMPAGDFEAATIAVKRGAEANAPLEVWITAREGEPAEVRVDGKRFALIARGEDLAPQQPAQLVAAIVAGKRAALFDRQGKQIAALSVAGASAALLYVDEQQRRLGTTTALVRRGARPASAVPAAPPLPVIDVAAGSPKPARALAKADLEAARKDSACEKPEEEGAPERFRLDARSTLALVPLRCGSGAYNFLSVALILDERGRASPARFDVQGDPGADNLIYGADWDPKSRRLGTYFKGRGIGDCGISQSYAWDGARFRLVEQSEMGECRGSIDYITTWRAGVRERR